MRLHTLKNVPGAAKGAVRVGRGESSGAGKTSGRGNKGQRARKGMSHKFGFEGGQMPLIRRIPKRGFKSPFRVSYLPVNVGDLERFADGEQVTAETLRAAGLANGRSEGIKILGNGSLTKKIHVKVQAYSASAREKIESVGGTCDTAELNS